MTDLISRQALCDYALNQKDKCITPNDIMRFPSAQPEQRSFSCGQENDLISRKAAIDALGKEGLITAMVIIGRVPSAQPERKKGKWLIDRGLYKCSYCNQLWAEWWAVSKPIERMNKEMPYCPICGSYNRREEGEQE